jgi:hypothetical protein
MTALKLAAPGYTADTSLQCMLSTIAVILSGQGIASHLARRVKERDSGAVTKRHGMACHQDNTLEIAALQEAVDGVHLKDAQAFRALRNWSNEAISHYAGHRIVQY